MKMLKPANVFATGSRTRDHGADGFSAVCPCCCSVVNGRVGSICSLFTPPRDAGAIFLFCDSVANVVSRLQFISSKNTVAANASSLHLNLFRREIMSRLTPAAAEKIGGYWR
jgi:hypothetical protein